MDLTWTTPEAVRSSPGAALAADAGWVRSGAIVIAGSALYGASFGLWRAPELAVYVAIKLPALLILTTLTVLLLNWTVAALLGSGLRLPQVAMLTHRALAASCAILASLAPVAAFVSVASPPPASGEHRTHNLLLLVHVLFVACAGCCGNRTICEGLRRQCRPGTRVGLLYVSWLAAWGFVGSQLAWMLRPFMGSPNEPVAFLRANALEGNFYEFLFWRVIRVLLADLFGG